VRDDGVTGSDDRRRGSAAAGGGDEDDDRTFCTDCDTFLAVIASCC